MPEWLKENYRGLVASGATRWDVLLHDAEASGDAVLAAFAADELAAAEAAAEAEAEAEAPPAKPAKS